MSIQLVSYRAARLGAYALLAMTAIHSSAVLAAAELVCRPCPFDCQGIGFTNDRHCSFRQGRAGECCVDLDGRGMDKLRETDQINQRNAQYGGGGYAQGYGGSHGDRPGEVQGDCPNGYHMNDRKCTDDERRRGCSDLRSPSGRLCVGWNRR